MGKYSSGAKSYKDERGRHIIKTIKFMDRKFIGDREKIN